MNADIIQIEQKLYVDYICMNVLLSLLDRTQPMPLNTKRINKSTLTTSHVFLGKQTHAPGL